MFYLPKHIEEMRAELDSLESMMELNKATPKTYKAIQAEYDLTAKMIALYDNEIALQNLDEIL